MQAKTRVSPPQQAKIGLAGTPVSVPHVSRSGRRPPMKILITAPENDSHTAPLKWALEQAGYSVACWAGLGWTETKQASISLFPDLEIKDTQLKFGHHLVEPGDVIWIRKPADPKPNPQT